MSKTHTNLIRHTLNGPTMGTRWSALFFTPQEWDPAPIRAALQKAVDHVDIQMSTWRSDSELMCLNRMPEGSNFIVSDDLARVLALGLTIGHASGGAFDIGMGDAVRAWGFGPDAANEQRIRSAMTEQRQSAYQALKLDGNRVHKRRSITLDLNGIAKGFGVDRLAEALRAFGINAALVSIDGELCAFGLRPNGEAWAVAIEVPDTERRAPHSLLLLQDAAVATSGDYRHWVNVQGHHLSHTMDPWRGTPLTASPASVTVIAPTCAEADAWSTAFMVIGPDAGAELAAQYRLSVLFLMRDGKGNIESKGYGVPFSG